MQLEIRHDEGARRFVVPLEHGQGELRYEKVDEHTLDCKSTFVPEAERDKGIGAQLVRHALEYARAHGLRVVPTCPFVGSYVDQHPEYQDIIAAAATRR